MKTIEWQNRIIVKVIVGGGRECGKLHKNNSQLSSILVDIFTNRAF